LNGEYSSLIKERKTQRVKVSPRGNSIPKWSKSQGGLPWGIHWSKRACEGWNWRTGTVYEATKAGRGCTANRSPNVP